MKSVYAIHRPICKTRRRCSRQCSNDGQFQY